MNKNFKIWGARSNLAGDMIFSLPIYSFLNQLYPDSYKYWVIAKKCSQFAPLFFNYPLIDCIRITENFESLGPKDIEIFNSCDIRINVAPNHPDGIPATTPESCWWNFYDVYQETFRMAGLHEKYYNDLPEELKVPRLVQWFDVTRSKGTIGIWPFTSYGVGSGRSPSLGWWKEFTEILIKDGYNVFQFGGLNDPVINDKARRFNELSIFEQIKISLGCDVNLNTNSGSGAILGAYGVRQISLLTDDAPFHKNNLLAFAPKNCDNNAINIFELGGCDNIKHEIVLENIKKLK